MVQLVSKAFSSVQPSASTHYGRLRECPSGLRTLCLTAVVNEDRLGTVVHSGLVDDPWLQDATAPLLTRFASILLTDQTDLIEPWLQQLHWLALDHGIDHVVLPLWPESKLAHAISMVAGTMGLPHDFILMQDEDDWPHEAAVHKAALRIA